MKALLYKEWFLLRTTGKTYLFMFLLFSGLTFAGVCSAPMVFTMTFVLAGMFPLSSMSLDETSNWESFAVATPAGRQGVVAAKYLACLLFTALACGLLLVMVVVFAAAGVLGDSMADTLASIFALATLPCIVNTVALPLLFRFGTQKSRLVLLGVIALITGLTGGTTTIVGTSHQFDGALGPLSLLALPLFYLSYRISLGIYRKRQF